MSESFLNSLTETISNVANVKTILGIGGFFGLVATGALPRIGFGRAINLGLQSKLFPSFRTKSVRKQDIQKMSDALSTLSDGEYIVITGAKGVGKTCMIGTALSGKLGVVFMDTQSGAMKDVILEKIMRDITNIRVLPYDIVASSKRVLWFYKMIFRSTPVVVISVPERELGQAYADVTAAVRALTDGLGVRVVVDGSPNSLPPGLGTTTREVVQYIDLMDKAVIEDISEYADLINFLKAYHLDDVVWKVLGGSPCDYSKLNKTFNKNRDFSDTAFLAVKGFIRSILQDACNSTVAKCSENTEEIIKVFREMKVVRLDNLKLRATKLKLQIDYPNKIFREVKRDKVWCVEPVTPAVGLIISENILTSEDVANLTDTLFLASPKINIHV